MADAWGRWAHRLGTLRYGNRFLAYDEFPILRRHLRARLRPRAIIAERSILPYHPSVCPKRYVNQWHCNNALPGCLLRTLQRLATSDHDVSPISSAQKFLSSSPSARRQGHHFARRNLPPTANRGQRPKPRRDSQDTSSLPSTRSTESFPSPTTSKDGI